MAVAFETLRQEGFIRMARVEGNAKWFRLTRSTARAEREPLVGAERMVAIEEHARALGKTLVEFSYADITERAGISHSGASYAMRELEERGVVTSRYDNTKGNAKLFRVVEVEEEIET